MKKSVTKCKLNNGFITSSDRYYSWWVAPQHCPLPLHPVIKCKAISGLTKKCKFELGLLTKKCKLFSGRVKLRKKNEVRRATKMFVFVDKGPAANTSDCCTTTP